MKRTISSLFLNFIKISGAFLLALCILNIIGMFYQSKGVRAEDPTGSTDYKYTSNVKSWNLKEGFAFLTMDSNGYNNSEFVQNPDVLLMGSSHMEAIQVPQSKNTAALLRNNLRDLGMSVYNIGMSSHTLYRCIDHLEAAIETYKPQKYVIIETASLNLNVKSIEQVLNGTWIRNEPSDSTGLLGIINRNPCASILHVQILEWLKQGGDAEPESSDIINDEYQIKVEEFIEYISSVSRSHHVTPMIFYSPAQKLSSDGEDFFETDEQKTALFKHFCEMNDVVFLDLTEAYHYAFINDHVMSHGFCNTAIGTGHLNQSGHRIAADSLSNTIYELEADK